VKIVHIITRLIVGGAQENTLLSCQGQHDRGHEVTLITGPPIGPEGSLLDRARAYGYRVEVIDEMRRAILPIKDWKTYRKLVARLRAIQPDIVHTHSSKAGIIARWAAHKAKVPGVVHTIHGLAFTASTSAIVNGVYKSLERWTAPISDAIVCVADAMREQSLAAKIGRPEQYVTVYSGMETGPFLDPPVPRRQTRERLGIGETDIVIGTIARLFYLKGHDDLLAIAPQLCARHPSVKFLWIGDGLLRGEFKSRIAAAGLKERFLLTGLVPPEQIPELVSAMDIVAHPSRREGLARAIAQGQLARCPVVTYDVDGNREGLIDGETGYAVKAFDEKAFGQRLELLVSDESLRRTMGAKGREFAAARFDANVMVEALEHVYRDVLAKKSLRFPPPPGEGAFDIERLRLLMHPLPSPPPSHK
jgi:glycosyltransferase involved in cell wall biosynthesis